MASVRTSPHAPPVKGTMAPSALMAMRQRFSGALASSFQRAWASPVCISLTRRPTASHRRRAVVFADRHPEKLFKHSTDMTKRHPPPRLDQMTLIEGENTLPTRRTGSRGMRAS